jgi:GT2 family glycosyltransferase
LFSRGEKGAEKMSSYSVAIRTIGKAGEKYQKLLDSISASNCRPEKVVVVLPEGAEPPPEQLGYEQFVYCPKSMIGQRLEALKYIQSDYTLFLDDDIAFPPDFVDKLIKPLEEGLFDCSTGPLFSFFPASKAGTVAGTLTASTSVSFFRRDMYVKILRSGGWSYHTFDTTKERYYPTESFAWTCFMIRTEVLRKLEMEDEICWLEKYGYAFGDDKVMAYKLIKRGYKACIVANALYDHNDAKTSTHSSEMVNTKPMFCTGHLHIVFWHRFIQDMEKSRFMKVCNSICFGYWYVSIHGYHLIKSLRPSYRPLFKAFREGLKAGKEYIRSQEYRDLPPVVGHRQFPGR